MSTSDLYAVFRTRATHLHAYRNGWGSGPAVWDHLNLHVLNGKPFAWAGSIELICALARNVSVDLPLRACLVMTFDGAVVPRANLAHMGELVAAGGAIIREAAPGMVCHFPQIGSDLAALHLDRRAVGVGLSCTSVSDTWAGCQPSETKVFDCYAYITEPNAEHGWPVMPEARTRD